MHRSRTRTPERERREREKQRGRGREGALQGHSRQLTGVAGCRGCKPRLQSLGRRSEHAHEFMGAFAARRARLVSSLRLLLLRAIPTNRHRPPAPGPATHRRLVDVPGPMPRTQPCAGPAAAPYHHAPAPRNRPGRQHGALDPFGSCRMGFATRALARLSAGGGDHAPFPSPICRPASSSSCAAHRSRVVGVAWHST